MTDRKSLAYCRLLDLRIDNFKNFDDFSMEFSPLTVIVGNNSVGKSSLLQAIAFLKYACTASVEEYLKDRAVKVEDLTSKGLTKVKKIMSFAVSFETVNKSIFWEITFLTDKTNNRIVLRSETVSYLEKGSEVKQTVLDFKNGKGIRNRRAEEVGKPMESESIFSGVFQSSLLKFIDERSEEKLYPEMCLIKRFFENTEPLDLLTPRNMRKTVRGKERVLGISGEKLPALIQQLTGNEKKKLVASLEKVLPNLKEIDSVTGRAGWTHLETREDFQNRQIKVPASGISDGTLRLMALFSLSFLNKSHGMILLDEVEDGINVANIQLFVEYLHKYIEQQEEQVVVTTHSSVVMDYVEPSEIRYFYRDEKGFTRCKNFMDIPNAKKQLDFLYPGEIILNSSEEELLADSNHDKE